jgi:hypothetical protein
MNRKNTDTILGVTSALWSTTLASILAVGVVGWWRQGRKVRAVICLLLMFLNISRAGFTWAAVIEDRLLAQADDEEMTDTFMDQQWADDQSPESVKLRHEILGLPLQAAAFRGTILNYDNA